MSSCCKRLDTSQLDKILTNDEYWSIEMGFDEAASNGTLWKRGGQGNLGNFGNQSQHDKRKEV